MDGNRIPLLCYYHACIHVRVYMSCVNDNSVARKLKQQSDFGMMLDYTTDIVTQAAMFMKICSIAPYYVVPAAIVVAVESAGMVLAIQASASGRYWKNTDRDTPIILRDYVMKNGVYTPLGDSLVFGHQAFVATTFMCLYNDALMWNGLWWALLPVSLANFTANSAIVYELCRKWQEPHRS
jgi:phosphatidylglycerophosphate synthase